MRSTLTLFAISIIIILFSCRRDAIDSPKPQADPKLKRTVTKDSAGIITYTRQYNDREQIIFDTAFNKNGTPSVWVANEYNNKGKQTKYLLTFPALTATGYHWMDIYEYKDDTVLVSYKHFLHGNQTFLTKYFYNTSGQYILDSNYHITFSGTIDKSYVRAYSYETQGRKKTETRLNEFSDSVSHIVYEYQNSPNHQEILKTSFGFNPRGSASSLTVTDFTSSGKILSEKTYAPINQLSSQTDYTYDGNGNLLKKVATSSIGVSEEHYFNNPITGKPEKMESFNRNRPLNIFTTFYYYE
jgi:hypothetical protein